MHLEEYSHCFMQFLASIHCLELLVVNRVTGLGLAELAATSFPAVGALRACFAGSADFAALVDLPGAESAADHIRQREVLLPPRPSDHVRTGLKAGETLHRVCKPLLDTV